MTSAILDPVVNPAADRRRPERRYVPGDGWEARVPKIASWICYAAAAMSLVTALLPPLRRLLAPLRGLLDLFFVGAPPNLAWAVLMAILASALGKRKRAAWGLLLFLECTELLLLILNVATFPTVLPLVLTPILIDACVITILLLARKEFFGISQRGNGWRALAVFAIGLVCSLAAGWVITTLFAGDDQLRSFNIMATEFFDVIGQDSSGSAFVYGGPKLISWVIGFFGSLTFIATAYVFFRPRRKDAMLTGPQEVQVRELLDEYGERDSLGYFATRRDKSVMFSDSGKAVVSYRVLFGTSLASADPIGDPEAWPAAIEAWLEEAHRHAWAPAVMGASKQGAEAYRRAGFGVIELGDEAILNFRDFQLNGRYMRAVRQAVNRVERAGYTARVRRHSDMSEEEMRQAIAKADEWRDTENERGFSMALGRMGDQLDGDSVLVETFDKNGDLQALLNFSPWGKTGLSLDLMRRSRTSENGVIEFMVSALVAAGPLIGADKLSLNFAVMRAVFEEGSRIGAGPIIRSTRWILVFASRWFQLESLYRSNQKYDPDWVPRYLLFESAGDLPRVGIAAAMAEGFVEIPSAGKLLKGNSAPKTSPLLDACAGSPTDLMADAIAAKELEMAQAEAAAAADPYAGMPEQEKFRRMKLEEMRANGIDPYSTSFTPTDSIAAVRAKYSGLGVDEHTGDTVSIAGRLMLNRGTGKLSFGTIRDWSGDLQVMISLAEAGEETLARWKSYVDLGDIIGVTGEVITSKRGELSVLASDFVITSKCLVPLPDKHKGFSNPEARVRQRYVDLIVNNDAREMLSMRSAMVKSIREFMWAREFQEVETPMMQTIHGGANARPFVTHINAYDMRLYMRIAPELYLKRLLVGGAPKVFELNRNFRNEGADSTHNPEFTSMEMYDAYGTYDTMRVMTRELIINAAIAVHGRPIVLRPDSSDPDAPFREVDISGEWPVKTVFDAVSEAVGEHITIDTDLATLAHICERLHINRDPAWDSAHVALELYEHLVEGPTTDPVFYTDFPTAVSPLTRKKPSEPRLAERWDLVAWGAEIGTAYTELIDPLDQRDRLTAQSMLAAAGNVEAMEVDEDFLRALEYGMPPAGGQGMGIDRLIMLLTGKNIRETVLFPIVRPDQQ